MDKCNKCQIELEPLRARRLCTQENYFLFLLHCSNQSNVSITMLIRTYSTTKGKENMNQRNKFPCRREVTPIRVRLYKIK
jgi:hypothetical protein